MDITTLTAVAGAVVTICSALTALLHTPLPDAPAWRRYGYRLIELLAVVGQRTKENPAAAGAALAAYVAARSGDLGGAARQAEAAYQALTK